MSGRIGALKTLGSGCVLSLVAPSAPMMLTVGRLVILADVWVLYCGVSCDGREISRFACQSWVEQIAKCAPRLCKSACLDAWVLGLHFSSGNNEDDDAELTF